MVALFYQNRILFLSLMVVSICLVECAPSNVYPGHYSRTNPFVHHHSHSLHQSQQQQQAQQASSQNIQTTQQMNQQQQQQPQSTQSIQNRASASTYHTDGRRIHSQTNSQNSLKSNILHNINNQHKNPDDYTIQSISFNEQSAGIGSHQTSISQIVNEVQFKLKSHAERFDRFFRDLLRVSHYNFHKMFSDTYGILYDRHASIFNDMFRDLETYYTNGKLDISNAMKNFFATLYKKMFEELNSQFAFDAKYLNCTVEHMEEMMPFGELPNKLIGQIRRSFVAVRTFVQALNYGSDILRTIAEAPLTSVCEDRLKFMRESKNICSQTCVTSIEKACFPYLQAINRDWNIYLNDVSKLASRLKTSFNIELAVKPMNIQISDAIMIFQDNGVLISQTLFNKCGKPSSQNNTRRAQRDLYMYNSSNSQHRLPSQQSRVYSTDSYLNQLHHGSNAHQSSSISLPSYSKSSSSPSPSSSTSSQISNLKNEASMGQLIGDIFRDFKAFRSFWTVLSKRLCSQLSSGGPLSCSSLSINDSQVPEVMSYRDRNNLEIVTRQTSILKAVSQNLKQAFNGLDVDLINNVKIAESGAINVSTDDPDNSDFEGSGESFSDDDEGGDDEDTEFDEGSGSGDSELINEVNNANNKISPGNGTINKEEFIFNSDNHTTSTESSTLSYDNDANANPNSKPSSATTHLPVFGIIVLTFWISFILTCSFLL